MAKRIAIAGALVVVAGCATVSQMTATSGSRSDGIVKLSFEYGMLDKVQIDQASALRTAQQRCGTWGYTGAEPFGGMTRQCQAYSGYGCMRWFATVEYQCTSTASVSGVTDPIAPVQATAAMNNPGDLPGTIDLGGGVKLVPAKIMSGYCIKAPTGYQGTGSVNRPTITKARPSCS